MLQRNFKLTVNMVRNMKVRKSITDKQKSLYGVFI